MEPVATPRLLLRPFAPGDLADLHAYRSQPGVGEAAGWPHHTDPAQSAQVLAKFLEDDDVLAVVYEGRVVGHLAVEPDSENGLPDVRELGAALSRDVQGRGLMTEAVRAVLARLFAGGMRQVWACCFADNAASRRMIEKCGFAFVQEGVFYAEKLNKTFPSREYVWERARWTAEAGQDL